MFWFMGLLVAGALLPRQPKAQLPRFALLQTLEEMAAAQSDIAVVAADLRLRARSDRMALGIDAKVHRRLAPAFAHRFQLDQRVREREQSRRPGKELSLEVGPEAVAEHRNPERVGDLAKLQHVALRQELRLVDEYAVELTLPQFPADRDEQVDTLVIGVGRGGQSDARSDRAGASAVVERGRPQHRFHAALAVIEIGLEQGGRFPRIHCRVIEIKLSHDRAYSSFPRKREPSFFFSWVPACAGMTSEWIKPATRPSGSRTTRCRGRGRSR